MLSKYFEIKTKTDKFKENLSSILNGLEGKKVILYGAGEGFLNLCKNFPFEKLNIVAISDKKFEKEKTFTINKTKLRAIPPSQIKDEQYDYMLITLENYPPILSYLTNSLQINPEIIKTVFRHEVKDENHNCNYLEKFKFSKTLAKLTKKLKGKKVVIYGAGIYFETIHEYYDLSGLNIIGISDMKFYNHEENQEYMGYKVCSPNEIEDLKPDFVLVAIKYYIDVIEELYYDHLRDTGICIKPLARKDFFTVLKEIWS